MKSLLVVALLTASAPAFAQSANPTPRSEGPVIDWLTANNIEVRKTFDGKSKDDGSPAAFSFNQPNSGGHFWQVDLAVKSDQWELTPSGQSITISPVFEWHRSTSATAEANKVAAGSNLEWIAGDLTQRSVAMILLVKATYTRDAVAGTSGQNESVLAGVKGGNAIGTGGNTWLPMSHINSSGLLVLRYAPYVGFERYANPAIESKGLPTVAAISLSGLSLHLEVDAYPLNTSKNPGWLELIGSYVYVRRVAGDTSAGNNLADASLDVSVYFDRAHHFAIGYSYERGRAASANFDDEHSASLGLKIKF